MQAWIYLTVVAYLGLLVDWKEMRGVLRQGGWATLCIYAVVTGVIVYALTHGGGAHPPAMHH